MLARRFASLASLVAVAGLVGCASTDDGASADESNLTTQPSDDEHQAKYDHHLSGLYGASGVKATVQTMIEKAGPFTAAFFSDSCTFTISGKLEDKTAKIRATDGRTASPVTGTLSLLDDVQGEHGLVSHLRIKLDGALSACGGAPKDALTGDGVEVTNYSTGGRVATFLTGYRIIAKKTKVLQPTTLEPVQPDGNDAVLQPGDVVKTEYDFDTQPADTIRVETFRSYGIFGSATGIVKLSDLAAQ